jgi:transposase
MEKYKSKIMQQLGIVSGVCNEIKLAEAIDRLIGKPKRKVSVGKAVQAMILNAMGFSNRALYLTPDFYDTRPVDILLGKDIQAEDLHDDSLGSALDAAYEYGVTELFYVVSTQALSTYGIEHRFVHLDSTTFSLHGKYDEKDENSPEVVKITKGYSKDKNPELNQVVLSLMCSYRSSIPVWLEVLSGNSSDKKSFAKSVKEYKKQFEKKKLPYIVADSALFTKDGLAELSETKWVTRVPETVKQAGEEIRKTEKDNLTPSLENGYWYREIETSYADIKQRWLIVFSEQAYKKEYETLVKAIRKECDAKDKELWHLSKKSFACAADALKAGEAFNKRLKYHTIPFTVVEKQKYGKKGRPNGNTNPVGKEYYLSGSIQIHPDKVGEARNRKGFFVIATNELDRTSITAEQLLSVYKAQGVSVERGFRFLKDPLFYAESLYLKSPKRIMALIMVMGLSLLVYSLAERKLRQVMAESKLSVPDQKGKPTSRPTLRWVFQIFEGIVVLYIHDESGIKRIVTNMKDKHKTVVQAFGIYVEKMYFL